MNSQYLVINSRLEYYSVKLLNFMQSHVAVVDIIIPKLWPSYG